MWFRGRQLGSSPLDGRGTRACPERSRMDEGAPTSGRKVVGTWMHQPTFVEPPHPFGALTRPEVGRAGSSLLLPRVPPREKGLLRQALSETGRSRSASRDLFRFGWISPRKPARWTRMLSTEAVDRSRRIASFGSGDSSRSGLTRRQGYRAGRDDFVGAARTRRVYDRHRGMQSVPGCSPYRVPAARLAAARAAIKAGSASGSKAPAIPASTKAPAANGVAR